MVEKSVSAEVTAGRGGGEISRLWGEEGIRAYDIMSVGLRWPRPSLDRYYWINTAQFFTYLQPDG